MNNNCFLYSEFHEGKDFLNLVPQENNLQDHGSWSHCDKISECSHGDFFSSRINNTMAHDSLNIMGDKDHCDKAQGDLQEKNFGQISEEPHDFLAENIQGSFQSHQLNQNQRIYLYLHCLASLREIYSDFLDSLDRFLAHQGYSEITSCQALMIYAIGERFLSLQDLGALTSKRNASYHGRKLLAQGYIQSSTNPRDKRMLAISLTPLGQGLCKHLEIFFHHHLTLFSEIFHATPSHWSAVQDQSKRLKGFYQGSLSWQLCKKDQEFLESLGVLKPAEPLREDFKMSSKLRYSPKHEVLGLWMKEYRAKEKNKEN